MKIRLFMLAFASLFAISSLSAQCSNSKSHAKQASWNHGQDIIDIASSSDDFSTLVVAVKTANLVKTLQGEGPFTVFAPLNSAFAKLPEGTVEALLKPENKDKLTSILTYHVIAGEFNATDVVNAINASNGKFTIKTVNGANLTASLNNGSVILTDANGNSSAVIKTDIDASNGVVHVIDTVVLP
ncbi:MAG: fasciclin domain-containing protein [Saprospiraceae bacterium]|nr:fasciclin domain-containing protein [Bacteroidia bacterium]MBT8228688.1 fasciclin domain-containing protein [Bacteroidia bacterium]NNF21628.1 fasciclin domain-containing protein [Saprospiraceae bacterium]